MLLSTFIAEYEAMSLRCSNGGISPPKNLSFLKLIIPKQQSLWEHAEQNSNIML